MLTWGQKAAAQAIVNVFETGRAEGDYACVARVAGDRGGLSYGRAQATRAGGALAAVVQAYCAEPGAREAAALRPFIERLAARDPRLDTDALLVAALKSAGADPLMRRVQDAYFDAAYWQPAVSAASRLRIASALGVAVVYDSHVHGSWAQLREQVRQSDPQLSGDRWVLAYLHRREAWLRSHPNRLLQRTVYRVEALAGLAREGRWDLALPLRVCGVAIDGSAIGPPVATPPPRVLRAVAPFQQGEDVRQLQLALVARFPELRVDGVYGPATAAAVRAWQRSVGLVDDGITGPLVRASLGL